MNIKTNSKEIKNNDIFVALKGAKDDGHNYIKEAIDNGASYIISDGDTNKFLNSILYDFSFNKNY